ncbi:hypothetical protein PMAYCL1PPCAC_19769, partial [Pristionchus mayeri]
TNETMFSRDRLDELESAKLKRESPKESPKKTLPVAETQMDSEKPKKTKPKKKMSKKKEEE